MTPRQYCRKRDRHPHHPKQIRIVIEPMAQYALLLLEDAYRAADEREELMRRIHERESPDS